MQITFEFDGLPISVNKLYCTNWKTKRRFKSPEASQWQSYVQSVVGDVTQLPVGILSIEIELYSDRWFTKAKKPRKVDLDNFIKSLIDAMFKPFDVDDSCIFQIIAKKLHGTQDKTIVKICCLDEH